MQLWFVATGTGVRQPALSMQHPFDQKSDGESRRGPAGDFPILAIAAFRRFLSEGQEGHLACKNLLWSTEDLFSRT